MPRGALILRLGVKELWSLWADPALLTAVLYAFTLHVLIAAFGVSLEIRNASIAIADEDRSPLSLHLADSFLRPYFRPAAVVALNAIGPSLDRGRYTFVLDIPSGFQADLLAGRRPELAINIDATAQTQAYVGAVYIQQILTAELARYLADRDVEIAYPVRQLLRVKYNANLQNSWTVGVSEMFSVIFLLSAVLPAMALLRERERGTIEHLLVMPLTPVEIMLAKVWSNALVVLIGAALCTVLTVRYVVGVPIQGSPLLFVFGVLVFQFTATGLGIMLATFARNFSQLALLIAMVMSPMIFLSGAYTPVESMPTLLKLIMMVSPLSYFVEFGDAVLFRGAGLAVVWPQIAIMAALGAVTFGLSVLRFRAAFAASVR